MAQSPDVSCTGGALRSFTYDLCGAAGGHIRALVLSGMPPDDDRREAMVTVYYPEGTIRFNAKTGNLPFGAGLVHTEHDAHTAEIHRPEEPFDWHAHIRVGESHVIDLVAGLLKRYGPADHRTHAARVGQLWESPRAVTFEDGVHATLELNRDTSGLGLLADLDLKKAAEEGPEAVATALKVAFVRLRPTSHEQILAMLVAAFGREAVAEFSGGPGGLGSFAHRIAQVAPLDLATAKLLVQTESQAQAARARDGNTIAHFVAMWLARAKTPAESRSLLAVLDHFTALGADLEVSNNYGETARDLLAGNRGNEKCRGKGNRGGGGKKNSNRGGRGRGNNRGRGKSHNGGRGDRRDSRPPPTRRNLRDTQSDSRAR